MISLTKPLAIIDTETTGTSVVNDRIVSLSAIILPVNQMNPFDKKHSWLINPMRPIPKEASDIHHITDETVMKSPFFSVVAKDIFAVLASCDLCGFNSNNFDVPLLSEEFARCGIDFPLQSTKLIDVGNIFKKKEERTLSAAVKFYLDREHTDAHTSDGDTKATLDILLAQLSKYPELSKMSVDELSEFSSFGSRVDFAGTIGIDADGDYIYLIGKNRNMKIKLDTGFAKWMLGRDFTLNTKKCVERILGELEGNSLPRRV